jgi:hypothetical protein
MPLLGSRTARDETTGWSGWPVAGQIRGSLHARGRHRVAARPTVLGIWLRQRGCASGIEIWLRGTATQGNRCHHRSREHQLTAGDAAVGDGALVYR